MFDFLSKAMQGIGFGAPPANGDMATAKKAAPPPMKAATPEGQPMAEPPHPAAMSEVFSGVADEGAYGVAASPAKAPAPPQAHTLDTMSRYQPFSDPKYRDKNFEHGYGQAEGESDEDFRKKLKSAAGEFGDKTYYSEEGAYDLEKDASRHQRAWWNGYTSEDRKEKLSDAKLAALKIGLNQGVSALKHDTPVKDLESPAGRMETLNILSQNMDPNDPDKKVTDEVSCVGASIVGGVLMAGGKQGLTKLYDAIQKPGAADETPEEKALREKLHSGKNLTLGDLQELQQMVYKKLKENDGMSEEEMAATVKIATESKDDKARAEAKQKLFVGNKGADKFMKDNLEIAEMFAKNKIDLVAIDTDDDKLNNGDGAGNHVVLRIDGKDGQPIAYYDPWKKKGDQGQIINAQDENLQRNCKEVPAAVLDDYKKAERVRGHYDQDMSGRKITEQILDRQGRPADRAWWTDEEEKEARRRDGG